jgi:hypothetical protein
MLTLYRLEDISTMPISMTVFGKDELANKYRRVRTEIPSALQGTMQSQMVQTADYVRSSKLSGSPLNRRSGALSRSIGGKATATDTTIVGTIFSRGVKYAFVHEEGGSFAIPSHDRLISQVFGKPVVPHTITIGAYTANYPQRAFLKPSLNERQAAIMQALRGTVQTVMNAT